MKKLLNISVIAALAVLPVAANATAADVNKQPTSINMQAEGAATTANNATASGAPKYELATAHDTDSNVATAGYVKGAYNAAIRAINKVSETADSALQESDITSGTGNGTIAVNGTDVSVTGLGSAAYTASTAYATAAQGTKADNAETLLGNETMGTTATTVTGAVAELKDAIDDLDDAVVKSVVEGTTNGTVSVDGTDVAVHGLGSAAYTASTDYASAAQGTKADNAETLLGNTAMGTTATTVTGAIKELKDASGDYATKTGVLATINASTVPVMATWGGTTPTTIGVEAPNNFVNQ